MVVVAATAATAAMVVDDGGVFSRASMLPSVLLTTPHAAQNAVHRRRAQLGTLHIIKYLLCSGRGHVFHVIRLCILYENNALWCTVIHEPLCQCPTIRCSDSPSSQFCTRRPSPCDSCRWQSRALAKLVKVIFLLCVFVWCARPRRPNRQDTCISGISDWCQCILKWSVSGYAATQTNVVLSSRGRRCRWNGLSSGRTEGIVCGVCTPTQHAVIDVGYVAAPCYICFLLWPTREQTTVSDTTV